MRLSLSAIDAVLAPAPDPARVRWLGAHEYAHRGVHAALAVENSPSAFAEAIFRGLGIECDVQVSRDGEALVYHDWELDRLTGESGPVAARDAAELETIALRGSPDSIPTLARLLAQVAGQVPLLVEIKSKRGRDPVPLCRAVRRALEGYRGPVAVMSFDPRVPKWFKDHAPLTVRGLVVTEEDNRGVRGRLGRHLALWHCRPDFLAYDVRDLPSRFAAAQRARGLPLLAWTVRSPELRTRAALHADAPIAEGAGLE
ncbi:glycerophosphodiester phosphodiesterase family protein [Altererythrobacter sp. TH136]|uniref:glycerophosphodiester phosphodiesterase family protein n=1 Tax=Altererythrobacter sp. TH136 TaxID=2067415 RepID=UPI0011647993|nr:glycerophosphodiester phosphodiesterase family protein [Altererythrobacter sp. TH136]QDM40896.1 glycerophosphodiester phosphodiesterase [Altererythrobacter sp. TH136]